MGDDESLPNALGRNTQNVKFAHGAGVLDEQHYRSGAYVLRVYGAVLFGACDVCAGGHACEDDEPCVLPQH